MIHKDENIINIIAEYPATLDVFVKHGMGCMSCAAAHYESLEEVALAHGIDIDVILNELNHFILEESNKGY